MGADDYKFATAESNSFEQLKTSSEVGGGGDGNSAGRPITKFAGHLLRPTHLKAEKAGLVLLKKTVYIKYINTVEERWLFNPNGHGIYRYESVTYSLLSCTFTIAPSHQFPSADTNAYPYTDNLRLFRTHSRNLVFPPPANRHRFE